MQIFILKNKNQIVQLNSYCRKKRSYIVRIVGTSLYLGNNLNSSNNNNNSTIYT